MRRGFTFIELLVVCIIVGLVSALVLPRIGEPSRRIVIEKAISQLTGAFNQTAMRARASGQPLELRLYPEDGRMLVCAMEDTLNKDWQPPLLTGGEMEDEEEVRGKILEGENDYEVSSDIEWTELPDYVEEDGAILFRFYSDGGAAGPELGLKIRDVPYVLHVDALTGRVTLSEISGL